MEERGAGGRKGRKGKGGYYMNNMYLYLSLSPSPPYMMHPTLHKYNSLSALTHTHPLYTTVHKCITTNSLTKRV